MTDAPINISIPGINLNIPWIEQRRIEARVLVPIVKAFQAELGEERANQIVRKALDAATRELAQAAGPQLPGNAVEKVVATLPIMAAGDALDVDVMKQTSDAYEFNVTGCRYAQFFKELDEPELGFLLLCGGDFALTEGLSPDLELRRTQTIMQGASHCDFRFRLKKKAGSE